MKLNEWAELYHRKTGELFSPDEKYTLIHDDEHGFCEYKIFPKHIQLRQLCGDCKFWVKIAMSIVLQLGLEAMCAKILRHPKPFIRALGFKLATTEEKEGYYRYTAYNEQNHKLIATQHKDFYFFEWIIKEGDEA